MENNVKNRQIWGNAMRESFFENVQLNNIFSHTSTNFQNVFREAAHMYLGGPARGVEFLLREINIAMPALSAWGIDRRSMTDQASYVSRENNERGPPHSGLEVGLAENASDNEPGRCAMNSHTTEWHRLCHNRVSVSVCE